tara:strand:- start:7101 stop:9695 length:2595 start_codon:yes stop_codon:yes gene_type:complete
MNLKPKKKIVITGGLGYIGSELCKLYSGLSWKYDITVIDRRFSSALVTQLRKWGFKYIQAGILDVSTIRGPLQNADVVIHLAGVTDVAYTATESNEELDSSIRETGVDGTRNIIELTSADCKIIFPSTHVVYEGFEDTMENISEEIQPTPVLTYSAGKVQSEEDLKNSGKNYVIVRLASVCGYSGDNMRINIMPNLFAKIASQGGQIKLFSGGVQLKSLVPLIDVARCFQFMEQHDEIRQEIFHCALESMTVKEVALMCQEFAPSVTLTETEDEIPNLGYTISNKKLLKTGFEFLYSIQGCIEEMVTNWSPHPIPPALEYTQQGANTYVDERGFITNYELTEPINLIGYIESKRGTIRANHFHPIQEQKCLLLKGRYISVVKDLLNPRSSLHTQIINPGDIAIIKPHVAHTMIFLEDSVFLNLVRGEREHDNYGVTHTLAYPLVDEVLKDSLLANYSRFCRVSGSAHLKPVLSLGFSPLANNLLDSPSEPEELFPLELVYCPESHNCQLSYSVPSSKMFDHYLYVSSTTQSFREHFERASEYYIKKFTLNHNSFVVDIGSNDGIALKPLQKKGIRTLGIEPATNVAQIANEAGVNTINEYFTKDLSGRITAQYGHADLITASNVFAHADNLTEIACAAFDVLKDDGVFIIEVQYLVDTIKDLTFDNIYHEHVNYWTVTSLNNFFNNLSSTIINVEHIDTHGGSLRLYVKRGEREISAAVEEFLSEEDKFGIKNYSTYRDFAERVKRCKENVLLNLKKLKNQNLVLAGYGAPAKATTALNYYGITSEEISYIIEDNPLKHNKYIPGVKIPIYSKDMVSKEPPDVIIVMAWNFFEVIKENNQDLLNKGIKFISIKDLANNDCLPLK